MVFKGSEIKSLRNGGGQLKDSYIAFRKNEAFLQKAHISPYEKTHGEGHEPERMRKLLLHQNELLKIQGASSEKRTDLYSYKTLFKKWKSQN